MAAVVQANCPGCKKSLRIPADWVEQAIRCKHCGLVMAARAASAPPAAVTRTPTPVKRMPTPPPALRKAPAPAVQTTPLPPTHNKPPIAVPVAPYAPIAQLVSPQGIPIAAVAMPAASPFDSLETNEFPASERAVRSSSKRGGAGWLFKGAVIAMAVLLLGGMGLITASFTPWGKRLLPAPPVQQVASNDDSSKPDDSVVVPVKTTPVEPVKNSDVPVKKPDVPVKKPDEPVKKPDVPVKKPDVPVKKPDEPVKKPDVPVKKPDEPIVKKPDPPPAGTNFPRRALVVSVHNYLYSNPVGAGQSLPMAHNMSYFVSKLNTALKIPLNQIAHLSDEAGKDKARGPNKQVIEKTLDAFVNSSREQDRIMVFLIGHAVEIDGEGYFVPIEGEMGNADTLISLKWIYEEMKNCKARQKVLVLDAGRFSPTRGVERPGSFPTKDDPYGPMTAKFDELLKTPPDGVQVWTSCVAEQMSYETDGSTVGVFIDKLTSVLEKGVQAANQRPEDALPLEKLQEAVADAMKEELTKFKLTQTPRLTGKEAESGAAFDPKAESAKPPVLAANLNNQDNLKQVQAILSELMTPPVKGAHGESGIQFETLPPFSEKAMKNYDADEKSEKLEPAIRQARAWLYAVAKVTPPKDLEKEYEVAVGKLGGKSLAILKDGFRYPQNENQFKTEIANHSRDVADILDEVKDAYKKLNDVGVDREKDPKRWVANYDFVAARLEEEAAYLYEYLSMLGQMRKELPPIDRALYNGWKLASTPTPSGDSDGKKKAKNAAKLLDKMAEENKGTPWEVLAKRERLTTLGLEWKAATVK